MLKHVRLADPSLLALLELLVEVVEHHAEDEASDNGDTKHGRDNTITLAVSACLETPDVRAGNVTELGKGVDESDGDGTLGRGTREGGTDPGVEDDETGVGRGLQEEGDVTACNIEGGHADDEADEANADGTNDVEELSSRLDFDLIRECQSGELTFSWVLSACQLTIREMIQANAHGGALMSRVGT